MSNEVRVRFAPSPTGHLHIGGARSALFNYLFARAQGGKFIVRIEDTDQARNIQEATDKLLDSLKWLGLEWDESTDIGGPHGPYRSMERVDIYTSYINQLIEAGWAYYCYMTAEELEAEREAQLARGEMPKYSGRDRNLTKEDREAYEAKGLKPVVRFKVPTGETVVIDDVVRGHVSFDTDGIGDFVICRSDGVPTYNFAVVIDDHLMEISHVVRGEEHLSNAPRQALIYKAFGWEPPRFAHASLILNPDGQKMSKRDETIMQFVEQYRDYGYLPEALVNFLALLGWSPGGEEELFTMDELIEQFSLERVSKAPAIFDTNKLAWMNNQYVKDADLDRLTELALPHLQQAGLVSDSLNEDDYAWVKELVSLYQEQMHYAGEIVELSGLFFKDELAYDEEAKEVLGWDNVGPVLRHFREELLALEAFTPEAVKQATKATQKATGQKGKQLFMPIRVAVSGQTHGPELPRAIHLLGRDVVAARLEQAAAIAENA
ncbi:glutamyl-tRNA synthetase /glutamate--tRNA(Gln) ligase [Salsuginibacillus halophilus]|uniref:Glutamate--tRNA ligase n=1 Tax=Salsuginibacillus halophilus TaxID=517424 RepID=A0A2P8H507_9BACI|nr:glutamate--tRNA ligase [Salsuginibacillus halophilus]PSL41301.1 glutamyl-tRNA synthetase /glutamate--tRNA(Gln) ligase [Salsuginibacillus halophilus]